MNSRKLKFVLLTMSLISILAACRKKSLDNNIPLQKLVDQFPEAPRKTGWMLHEKLSDHIVSLNGIWKIAEGTMENIPKEFTHEVTVPGLVSEAEPEFKNVGLPVKGRTAFWYKKTFTLNTYDYKNVFLKIYKAKYGTGVFVNGKKAGENMLNFSSALINITPYLNPPGKTNELLVRIGAHIDSLPDTVSNGGEVEKFRYMPGIYDYAELIFTGDIYFSTVQVAPEPAKNQIVIEAGLSDLGKDLVIDLQAEISESKEKSAAIRHTEKGIHLSKDSTTTVRFTVNLPTPHLWTPEDPFLYTLKLTAGNITYHTRFGMRSFRLDSNYTNRALLNGRPYFFRGTNIALFRFFEDPACKGQPWNPGWVRKLFRTFKSLGMNSARTTICSFPEFWYEIADEEGFALFAEYPMWYALKKGVSRADFDQESKDPQRKYGIYPETLTAARLTNEYAKWMQDLWNHASVIAWDAQNETWTKSTGEAIKLVRNLDLSDRPWDNGWSPPPTPHDYREAHQYFARYRAGSEAKNAISGANKPFRLSDLSDAVKIPGTLYIPYQYAYGLPFNNYTNQPCVLNEYGYLWLNRDGTPTTLTKPYYDAVLGPGATGTDRRKFYAYMLGALTEYWRSARTCFGVLQVFGLDYSLPPKGATSDNFMDVDKLELDPYFEKAMKSAFSPVGICIESWKEQYNPRQDYDIPVVVTNDLPDSVNTSFIFRLILHGKDSTFQEQKVILAPWQQVRFYKRMYLAPDAEKGEIQAVMKYPEDNEVISTRYFKIKQ